MICSRRPDRHDCRDRGSEGIIGGACGLVGVANVLGIVVPAHSHGLPSGASHHTWRTIAAPVAASQRHRDTIGLVVLIGGRRDGGALAPRVLLHLRSTARSTRRRHPHRSCSRSISVPPVRHSRCTS